MGKVEAFNGDSSIVISSGVVAGIPAKKGEEVDYGLGQIARLAVTGAYLATFRMPFEWEYRSPDGRRRAC